MTRFFTVILINIAVTLSLFYVFIFSNTVLVDEGITLDKNINREKSKIILSEKSVLNGDINLEIGEIIFRDYSKINGSIYLDKGYIKIGEGVVITGDIITQGEITIGSGSVVEGNISTQSELKKHSTSQVLGESPSLFITTDYPQFLKYFDVLPENHKEAFGYIFLTSDNMDIRGEDKKPEEYFQNIYVYKNKKLEEINKSENPELIQELYKNASKYINIIPERNVSRFGVAFVTKNYANDKKFADMYMSSQNAESLLFMHETGHILDYKYAFIDYYNPIYPYPDKDSSITEYGKFHKGEDFAEAYRYYILHHDSFLAKAKENSVIKEKYNYLKQYVFNGKEYF